MPDYNLPADLPTNWNASQAITPQGTETGLSPQHGYNYLNKQINDAQTAVNDAGTKLDAQEARIEDLEQGEGFEVDYRGTTYGPQGFATLIQEEQDAQNQKDLEQDEKISDINTIISRRTGVLYIAQIASGKGDGSTPENACAASNIKYYAMFQTTQDFDMVATSDIRAVIGVYQYGYGVTRLDSQGFNINQISVMGARFNLLNRGLLGNTTIIAYNSYIVMNQSSELSSILAYNSVINLAGQQQFTATSRAVTLEGSTLLVERNASVTLTNISAIFGYSQAASTGVIYTPLTVNGTQVNSTNWGSYFEFPNNSILSIGGAIVQAPSTN